ncbi:nickel ABC transporter substrate-binding protein [Helicobacter sp. MIT 21-1697]|uniref:nickel ABC transporter substrate-binding protein n=1 Tax=Helicobacter sp. MIT 21-1697 TaxID=2993733 RepID=UPI00224B5547|nr:nickel ABC transporter substrate-binding protein [Helicobacter sp. MIT 21-1697]MCX2716433.1 nickel ABC transporter substrate-binding protein [Helicobacter sp. MIT 21-1697]
MRVIVIVFICIGVLWGKNTLIMAVSENIGALNPQGYQGNAMFAQNAIYEGLVRVDKQGKIIPSLALSWHISQDGLSYEFTLREGVKFSNGETFNADAVVLNFQSILKNRARHSWSGLAMAIKDIQKVSEYKVRLLLKHPYSPTLNELSVARPFRFLAPSAMPKDLDLIKHNPKPIGTGAYMLSDSKLGVSDTLLKNPHYWDKEAYNGIYYDEVILKVIFDPNAKLAALKSKQIDMIYGYDQIPLEIFKNMQNDKHFNTYLSPSIYSTSLVINSASPILALSNEKSSQSLRKIIALGIDKAKITQAVYGGLQERADMIFAPTFVHSLGSHNAPKILPYKPKEAKGAIALLLQDSQAVLLRHRGVEILFSGDNPAHKMMAEILQSEFKTIGIKARLSASEPTIYRNRLVKGAFDMAFSETWGAPYEPLSMLYSMLIPSHIDFAAQAGLSQKPYIDKLIRELIALNPRSQIFYTTLSEVIALLQESGVYIPLTYQRNKAIAHKKIKGIKMGVVSYEVPFWEMYE